MVIVPLVIEDYDDVYAFWRNIEGMGLSGADSREGITAYLNRNPGMSMVARNGDTVAGTILCGHDGRRGFIHHLAVAEEFRGRGLGTQLVEGCKKNFRKAGIQKCHIFIYTDNESGKEFWRSEEWKERDDLCLFSHDINYPGY